MRKVHFGLAIICFVLLWLFVGIFRDDEFYDPYLFIKHRPTLKVHFYSPIGMTDNTLADLTAEQRYEEIAFQEFVDNRGVQNEPDGQWWFVPFLLIQLLITSLLSAYRPCADTKGCVKKFIIHIILNISITSIALAFALTFDRALATFILAAIVLLINYFVWKFLRTRIRTL
jgi:hypothetical protein